MVIDATNPIAAAPPVNGCVAVLSQTRMNPYGKIAKNVAGSKIGKGI